MYINSAAKLLQIFGIHKDLTIKIEFICIFSGKNLITNIPQKLFDEVGQGRDFVIKVKGDLYIIEEISESYDDVDHLDPVAIFGTHGYLELALNHAKMASLWGIELRSTIQVVFKDS